MVNPFEVGQKVGEKRGGEFQAKKELPRIFRELEEKINSSPFPDAQKAELTEKLIALHSCPVEKAGGEDVFASNVEKREAFLELQKEIDSVVSGFGKESEAKPEPEKISVEEFKEKYSGKEYLSDTRWLKVVRYFEEQGIVLVTKGEKGSRGKREEIPINEFISQVSAMQEMGGGRRRKKKKEEPAEEPEIEIEDIKDEDVWEMNVSLVDSFEELYKALSAMKEIKGTSETFSAEEVIDYIDSAKNILLAPEARTNMKNEVSELNELLLRITRSYGIREKVFELLEKEGINVIRKEEKKTEEPTDEKNEFDPEKELGNILNVPKSERSEKVKEIKRKLLEQQERLAEIQENIINEIRKNPDASFDELYEMATTAGEQVGMNEKQKEIAKKVISAYVAKHNKIKEVRAQYFDDKELFNALFGAQPVGEIEVIQGPMTLYFRCFDVRDYTLIRKPGLLDSSDITDEHIAEANTTGGTSIASSRIPGLEGTIIAENSSLPMYNSKSPENNQKESDYTRIHEEQHAIKRLFREKKRIDELSNVETIEKLKEVKTREEALMGLKRFFQFHREFGEIGAKDEMLAYLKDGGLNRDQIISSLTKSEKDGGIYDYFSDKEELKKFISENIAEEYKDLADEVMNQVFEVEYRKLLEKSIDAFRRLEQNGYSKDKAIALLIHEPLSRWEKVVNRLLEETDKKLLELKSAVEDARNGYARKDYEVTNVFAKLKKLFGKSMKTDTENVSDMQSFYNAYRKSLNEYLDYRIEGIKKNNLLSPEELRKEMGGLVKEFNWEEKINLYEARTNARAEARKDKFDYKALKAVESAVNRYRKLDWKIKLAVSAALLGTGVGAGFALTSGIAGAAGFVSLVSTAKGGQKILSGLSAGVGAVGMQEAVRRKLDTRKAEKDKEKILKDLEKVGDAEERFNALMGRMQSEVDTYKSSLEREKRKARNRRIVGAGMGIFIGSGAMAVLGRTLYQAESVSDIKEWMKEKIFGYVESVEGVKTMPEGGKNVSDSLKKTASGSMFERNRIQTKGVFDKIPSGGEVAEVKPSAPLAAEVTEDQKATTPDIARPSVPEVEPEKPLGATEPTDKTIEKPAAPVPEKPATETAAGKAPEKDIASRGKTISGVETVKRGDSSWKVLRRQLEARFGEEEAYKKLSPEQKTYLIDHLKDKIAANPKSFGLENADKLKVGQKIELTRLFEDKDDINKAFEKAQGLADKDIKNIAANNETIKDWTEKHPRSRLTSQKVEEILQDRQKGTGATASVEEHSSVPENLPMGDAQPEKTVVAASRESLGENAFDFRKFVGNYDRYFSRMNETGGKIDDILRQYPDMKNADISSMRAFLREVDERVVSGDESAIGEKMRLEDMIDKYEKLARLTVDFRTEYQRVTSNIYASLFQNDSVIKKPGDIKLTEAVQYLENNPNSILAKIVQGVANDSRGGFDKTLIPKPGEKLADWTGKFVQKTFDSENISREKIASYIV